MMINCYKQSKKFASSVVDHNLSQTKVYKIGICCFSAKHAVLKRKNKDWLTGNQDNAFEWGDILTRGSVVSVS